VNQPVENAVGERWIADLLGPVTWDVWMRKK